MQQLLLQWGEHVWTAVPKWVQEDARQWWPLLVPMNAVQDGGVQKWAAVEAALLQIRFVPQQCSQVLFTLQEWGAEEEGVRLVINLWNQGHDAFQQGQYIDAICPLLSLCDVSSSQESRKLHSMVLAQLFSFEITAQSSVLDALVLSADDICMYVDATALRHPSVQRTVLQASASFAPEDADRATAHFLHHAAPLDQPTLAACLCSPHNASSILYPHLQWSKIPDAICCSLLSAPCEVPASTVIAMARCLVSMLQEASHPLYCEEHVIFRPLLDKNYCSYPLTSAFSIIKALLRPNAAFKCRATADAFLSLVVKNQDGTMLDSLLHGCFQGDQLPPLGVGMLAIRMYCSALQQGIETPMTRSAWICSRIEHDNEIQAVFDSLVQETRPIHEALADVSVTEAEMIHRYFTATFSMHPVPAPVVSDWIQWILDHAHALERFDVNMLSPFLEQPPPIPFPLVQLLPFLVIKTTLCKQLLEGVWKTGGSYSALLDYWSKYSRQKIVDARALLEVAANYGFYQLDKAETLLRAIYESPWRRIIQTNESLVDWVNYVLPTFLIGIIHVFPTERPKALRYNTIWILFSSTLIPLQYGPCESEKSLTGRTLLNSDRFDRLLASFRL